MGLLALTLVLVAGQAPQRAAPDTRAGIAMIRGRVIAAGTNTPVARAVVELSGTREHPMRSRLTLSANDGAFEFAGLEAGPYSVSARPNRYQLQLLGSPRIAATAVDRQITAGVDIALPRAAVIVGRIVADGGQPMGGVRVSACPVGDRPGVVSAETMSDEYGRYRLNHLEPGAYYVVAKPLDSDDPIGTETVGFLETYNPGTPTRADAARIQVRNGDEVDAGDLRPLRGRMFQVGGIVVDSEGKMAPPNRTTVWLSGAGGGQGESVDPQGRFDFGHRLAGSYRLEAQIRVEAGGGVLEFGDLPLTLAETDPGDIVLATRPAGRVTGRVVVEEAALPSTASLSVEALAPSSISLYLGPDRAPLTDQMTFDFSHLAGERLLRVSNPGPGLPPMRQTVFRGAEEVTNVPTTFTPGDSVRIVLSPHVSRVEGTVTIDGVQPAASRDVIVFAEDRRTWVRWSSAVQVARTDQRGHYLSPPLPPGRYYVVAVPQDRSLPSDNNDPTILKGLVPEATAITLSIDETRTVDLRLLAGGY